MLLTRFFLPVLKENPKEAEIISHIYMLRAGMIQQSASGIYSWLPLGKIVLEKITEICRQEMIKAGANEILMPTLQSAEIWKESGRYEDYGKEMLRIKDRNNRNLLYGPTNEELVTEIFRTHVNSYKELPLNLFHIQWKFRDELRPRFGVMRGREFLMKDAYSFDVDYNCSIKSYNIMFIAYMQLFKKMGLKAIPMKADTGPIGGDLSHEFIILADTGESKIYTDRRIFEVDSSNTSTQRDSLVQLRKSFEKYYAVTDEKFNKNEFEKNVTEQNRLQTKGIEVGHIFYFGDKYSKPMNASVDYNGKKEFVKMGSYGIGVSRLVGAIIEAKYDDKNEIMKWPMSVSPYDCSILPIINKNDNSNLEKGIKIYDTLKKNNLDVLIDDTDENLSSKIKKFNLLGIPYQIIIGKNFNEKKIELKEIGKEAIYVSLEEIIKIIKNKKAN